MMMIILMINDDYSNTSYNNINNNDHDYATEVMKMRMIIIKK